MTETLHEIELDLIFFIERFHAQNGRTPTLSEIGIRFTGLTETILEGFQSNPLVQKSFKARGITYPAAEDSFTADQMHAVAAMMDLVDRRSDEKKLRDIGVTTRQWAQWLQDDNFANYVRNRSEKLLANSVHEAHKALVKGARQGNVSSAKLLYEITGRHDPTKEAQIDIRRVLHTFIEIIQRYVKDPVLLNSIAMDLSQVASAESFSTGLTNQMMSGAITARQQTINGTAVSQSSLPLPPGFED